MMYTPCYMRKEASCKQKCNDFDAHRSVVCILEEVMITVDCKSERKSEEVAALRASVRLAMAGSPPSLRAMSSLLSCSIVK